jgi:hypothetical protein
MEKWCVKPENTEEAFIVGKWFDENWGCSGSKKEDKEFYQRKRECQVYYIYGRSPGNVYTSNPEGKKLTFEEFLIHNKIQNNIEPTYEIY